jgi:hypothetical protein
VVVFILIYTLNASFSEEKSEISLRWERKNDSHQRFNAAYATITIRMLFTMWRRGNSDNMCWNATGKTK